jgi:cobalt-zinc-cadmium efflux system membrane fusion protein
MNDDMVSVYVETSPWVFQRREIKLALEDDNHVRVLAGLHAGERIVQSGGVFIND